MRNRRGLLSSAIVLATSWVVSAGDDGNRLTYLDETDPYYVGREFPKLVTPQWVGEAGVEGVVILSIDDLSDHANYEAFLRPVLERLEGIDGRAPVSICCNRPNPDEPHLQKWLAEGLSLEAHTLDHPCPCLQGADFDRAARTYHDCVDLMHRIPNHRPVAFRMPCMDSINSASPRFYVEMFNRTSSEGRFLSMSSSICCLLTSRNPALPRELVMDASGRERFRKYLPAGRTFINYVEDYPYPFVVARLCWEMPAAIPDDWQAQHLNGKCSPKSVADYKAAIDATLLERGVFTMVFHPHGWIGNEQIVELVDHAVAKHGKKVKFLTLEEAQERLDRHLLGGQSLRAENGQDNGVRVLDVNHDGYLDVVIGNDKVRRTRIWSPTDKRWVTGDFPVPLVEIDDDGNRSEAGVRFGVLQPSGYASFYVRNETTAGIFHFDGQAWVKDDAMLTGLELDGQPVLTRGEGVDRGVRLRDLDGDGWCEVLVSNPSQQAVFAWSDDKRTWSRADFTLPAGTSIVNAKGADAGLRFVDLDRDGRDDVVFSNHEGYSIHRFTSMAKGWADEALSGGRSDADALPMIVREDGTNNGVWFALDHVWAQNEHTAGLSDHVYRRHYHSLLANVEPQPKSPQASRDAMVVRPGFTVELMVHEPMTMDPVAFEWGPDGKFWIVEMADYPLGLDDKGKPGGRVRYLEDTDGDGRYDKSTLFMDQIGYPNDLTPWRNGVLVTAAPEIFYAEDTDGDGKADVKQTLYTGFGEWNQQHLVNGPRWGLDNWLYVANGDSGGKVKSIKTGRVVDISGRDLRIRPDTGAIEAQLGQTQYGRSRDDWGNWFGNNNSNPIWHFALADHYLRRNPHYAPPRANVDLNRSRDVYGISRVMSHWFGYKPPPPGEPGQFTSACGTTIYRDELFGPEFAMNSFTSESVFNVVHRRVLTEDGVTFTARRAPGEESSEFLASRDSWSRLASVRTGPDGALWVADMYRLVIEHPEWIDDELEKRLDLRAGCDKGRIYRIYPTGAELRPIPRLDRLDAKGLVAALESPNGPQRDLVHQMLVWKRDADAIAPLKRMASQGRRPQARLHALCALEGVGGLEPDVVRQALADPHPGVRRHAVRLSEAFLETSSSPLGETLLGMVEDPSLPVRMQLAYSLGEWDEARAGEALGRLAVDHADDRFIVAAVMSSATKRPQDILTVLFEADQRGAAIGNVVRQLVTLCVAREDQDGRIVQQLIDEIAKSTPKGYSPWQLDVLTEILDRLGGRGGETRFRDVLTRSSPVFDAAREMVENEDAAPAARVSAVGLLGTHPGRDEQNLDVLAGLLEPWVEVPLQQAAVTALARMGHARVATALLEGWSGYSPTLQAQVMNVLMRREPWTVALLDAVEAEKIDPIELGATRRQQLEEHESSEIRQRAAKLLGVKSNEDRQKIIDVYLPEVSRTEGDPERGAELFVEHCGACHKIGGLGFGSGPDLGALPDRSALFMVTAVIDPNRAVEEKYLNYMAETVDGDTHAGMIVTETSTSITIVGLSGEEQAILRNDLESLQRSRLSVMPEGLEEYLEPGDLADVIAFVNANTAPPKQLPGNRPELVKAQADGSLNLKASNAAIYGPTIVFETRYGNLGFWSSPKDHAIWSADVARAGRYDVWMNWAVPDPLADQPFILQAGPARIESKVPGTGGWDNYREERIGTLTLPAGRVRFVFRPAGDLRGPMIDLRGLRLVRPE